MSIKIYQVGGSIRDELLGITKITDLDYAVEAPSYAEMVEYLTKQGYVIFVEKPEFFTVRAKDPTSRVVSDFTLCRKDGEYTDSRRPDSVHHGTIYDDLARRDFTVNAIARDSDGVYLDPYNGRKDLQDGLLRCVGSTHDRLWEDSLRVLRGLRFMITKDFSMEAELYNAIFTPADELIKKISAVSIERRQKELQLMFQHNTVYTMTILARLPVKMLEAIFSDNLWLLPTMRKVK